MNPDFQWNLVDSQYILHVTSALYQTKRLLIWKGGWHKECEGKMFVLPLVKDLFNRDWITKQDRMSSVSSSF